MDNKKILLIYIIGIYCKEYIIIDPKMYSNS